MYLLRLYLHFLLVAAILDFHSQLGIKKIKSTYSVVFVTLGSEKLQFSKSI